MSYLPSGAAVYCSLVLVVLGFLVFTRRKKSVLPLPPGPPKLPIIGNLLNLPSQSEWMDFQRWGKEYGLSNAFSYEAAENINNRLH